MPTAPSQCGSALQHFHCPLPQGSVACIAGDAQHTTHGQCGGALQDFNCPQALWHCNTRLQAPAAPRQCGGALAEFKGHGPKAPWR